MAAEFANRVHPVVSTNVAECRMLLCESSITCVDAEQCDNDDHLKLDLHWCFGRLNITLQQFDL